MKIINKPQGLYTSENNVINMQDDEIRQAILAKVPANVIADLQLSINDLKKQGQFKQYVAQRKLALIMGKDGALLDNLLDLGILH